MIQMNVALFDLPTKVLGEVGNYMEQTFTRKEIAETLAQMCRSRPGWSSSSIFSKALELSEGGGGLNMSVYTK